MSAFNKLVVSLTPDMMALLTIINRLIDGEVNSIGKFTLTNGATSTTLTDGHIKPTSYIKFTAQTADAAAVTGMWYDPSSIPMNGGKVTVHHSNPGATDATFGYVVHT